MSVVADPYRNPSARAVRLRRPPGDAADFHRGLPDYAPTPLLELPPLARELGVGRVFVKDESSRLGLPAFKMLGASYAVARVLSQRWGQPDRAMSLPDLQERAATEPSLRIFAATDGNHGRAVAAMAARVGVGATVYLPADLTASAKAAIADEGAETVELDLPYDDVVTRMALAARAAGPEAIVVQDTSWEGYTTVPSWIVEGYSTMLVELDVQLAAAGASGVELVIAPAGVGSLAQAIVTHFRSGDTAPSVTLVEPVVAPALHHALSAGVPGQAGTGDTVMKGLNCGTPSGLAWPVLRDGADAAVLITDAEAIRAVSDLEGLDVDAGPCGAASLAGARRALASAGSPPVAADGVVVLFNTESRGANPLPPAAT